MTPRFTVIVPAFLALRLSSFAAGEEWDPRQPFLESLVREVRQIHNSQDAKTGRFGKEPWCCTDQNVIFPLAAAWAIEDKANPWHADKTLLGAIMAGGDALIEAQDKNGMWTFRKKDNSTWGQIWMPWTYSRWIRAFELIRDAMPPERRTRWQNGLALGFEGLNRTMPAGKPHNILAHHAMALYRAGDCFGRDDWKQTARATMARVVAAQDPGGWWSEHSGPVVAYNFVYVEALGLYYAKSHDAAVLDALRRAAIFHAMFVYPDGTIVETVDERNPYEPGTAHGDVGFKFTPVEANVGFSFTPEGRSFLHRQYTGRKWSVTADVAASHLLYGERGPCAAARDDGNAVVSVLGHDEAMVLRRAPWFICMSAFTCQQPLSRWHQDRQNFVSIFHDDVGLLIGGGNTKLQPFWSNFTIGDTSGLQHVPGDENPDFRPKKGLIHMPTAAVLHVREDCPALDLTYGSARCSIAIRPIDDRRLSLVHQVSGDHQGDVEAHVVFLPRLGSTLRTEAGKSTLLGEEAIEWSAGDIGRWLEYGGMRIGVPEGARLSWPKKRHNPYRKDGHSTVAEARLVLSLPLPADVPRQEIPIEIIAPRVQPGSPTRP